MKTVLTVFKKNKKVFFVIGIIGLIMATRMAVICTGLVDMEIPIPITVMDIIHVLTTVMGTVVITITIVRTIHPIMPVPILVITMAMGQVLTIQGIGNKM